MVGIQAEITMRAVELLQLPPGQVSMILDVGCGSGLSGKVLEEQGHYWVGCDGKLKRTEYNKETEKNERMKE